jgi:rhamnosyl/mannosyltransferase
LPGPTRGSRSVSLPPSRPPADRLRVVHLGKYYPPAAGGIETHTRDLALTQAALGTDVRVVVVNHAAADGRDVTFDRFAATPPADDRDGPVRVLRAGRWANLAKLDIAPGLPGLLRKMLRDPPDVWHLHTPNVTMMLAVLASPRIRPLVVTHHSDIVRQRVLKYVVRPAENAVYRRAARILPTSPAYVEGSEVLKRFADKLTPLPLGIELSTFRHPSPAAERAAAEFRAKYPGPLWLCVGRLIYYKGLHVALDALRYVPGTLLVVGTGPLEADLKRRAEELGVAGRVAWLGAADADRLVGAYHAATAFWFPSVARSEGFGIVQVEAMAAGCPVINTAIPGSGVAWVCRHEKEGLTVPVNDPAAFAAAANRLAADPGLRARLAAAGRERAAAEFDRTVMGRRSLDVYRAVLAGPPARR